MLVGQGVDDRIDEAVCVADPGDDAVDQMWHGYIGKRHDQVEQEEGQPADYKQT